MATRPFAPVGNTGTLADQYKALYNGNIAHAVNTLQQVQRIEPKEKTLQPLRASVITYWIKTLNLRETQHRAGHRYVSSTEAYLINDLEGLVEDVARFHPIG